MIWNCVFAHKNAVQALLLLLKSLILYRKTLKVVHSFHIVLQLLGDFSPRTSTALDPIVGFCSLLRHTAVQFNA